MGAMTTIGDKTRTIFLQEENHKLHVEFIAASQIRAGMPVKLDATGKVSPFVTGDTADFIGIARKDAATDTVVTVAVRGYMVTNVYSQAALSPGMARFHSHLYNAGTGENYALVTTTSVTATNLTGWVLDSAGAANVLVRMLVKD